MLNGAPVAVLARPSQTMNEGLRSFVPKFWADQPVNLHAAYNEYRGFRRILKHAGINVIDLCSDREYRSATKGFGDRQFVEDVGRCVFDPLSDRKLFVQSRMGVHQRTDEPNHALEALRRRRLLDDVQTVSISDICPGASLEAGDMLNLSIDGYYYIVIGRSSRTNSAAINALRNYIELMPEFHNVRVIQVNLRPEAGPHLTTVAGAANRSTVILDPTMVDSDVPHIFEQIGAQVIMISKEDQGQPNCANCLWLPTTNQVLMDNRFESTINQVTKRLKVVPVANIEHGKIAGGISCRVLRFGTDWYWKSAA